MFHSFKTFGWIYTSHCGCHMSIQSTKYTFICGEYHFPGEKEQTSLASQFIRILLLFSRSDLAVTGEQALQEPRTSRITPRT